MMRRLKRDSRAALSAPATLAAAFCVACLVSACQKPPVVSIGQPLAQGDVTVLVSSAELVYLDLEGPTGAARTQDPVMKITLSIINQGSESVRYDLGWPSQTSTQAVAPLLFLDPGEEIELPIPGNIPILQLSSYAYLDDPIVEATRIEPGATITDVLLFQRPPADATGLLLSLPPTIFGPDVKMPGYVRIPFTYPAEIPEPQPIGIGDVYSGAGFTFVLESIEQNYIPLTNRAGRAGFSASPLLRLNFDVTNTSDTTIEYIPTRANRSLDPPTLLDQGNAPTEQANFDDGITAEGFVNERRQIGPGESFRSFLLFRRPPASTSQLTLIIPGKRFASTGLIRVSFPYSEVDVPLPDEMVPDEPEPEPSEDGETEGEGEGGDE